MRVAHFEISVGPLTLFDGPLIGGVEDVRCIPAARMPPPKLYSLTHSLGQPTSFPLPVLSCL